MSASGKVIGSRTYPSKYSELRDLLLQVRHPLPNSTVMLRKSVVDDVGGYDEFFEKAEDYAFLLRLMQNYQLGSIPEPLLLYSYRTDSEAGNDGVAKQLRFDLLARALYSQGLLLGRSFVDPGINKSFINRFDDWFVDRGFAKLHKSALERRNCLRLYAEHRYVASFISLLRSILIDPGYIGRKLTGSQSLWHDQYDQVFSSWV